MPLAHYTAQDNYNEDYPLKSTLNRIAQSCLALCLSKQQPLQKLESLELSPAQLQALDMLEVRAIRLEYSGKDRSVIQHSSWATGAKDDYLPHALSDIPRDTLVITRITPGVVELFGGPAYQSMNPLQFDDLVSHLLANTRDSINFFGIMQRPPMVDTYDHQPAAA